MAPAFSDQLFDGPPGHIASQLSMVVIAEATFAAVDLLLALGILLLVRRRPDLGSRSILTVLALFLGGAGLVHAGAFLAWLLDAPALQSWAALAAVLGSLVTLVALLVVLPSLLRLPTRASYAALQARSSQLVERLDTTRDRVLERSGLLATLIDMLDCGIVISNADQSFVTMNRAAQTILGRPGADGVETRLRDLEPRDGIDGRPLAADELPLARARRGEIVDDARLTIRHPERGPTPLSISARPIVSMRGELQATLAIVHQLDSDDRRH